MAELDRRPAAEAWEVARRSLHCVRPVLPPRHQDTKVINLGVLVSWWLEAFEFCGLYLADSVARSADWCFRGDRHFGNRAVASLKAIAPRLQPASQPGQDRAI